MTEQSEALWAADALQLNHKQAAAEIRRLQTENESLRADAERYRWLRRRVWFQCEFDTRYGDSGKTLLEFDAGIDAAMKRYAT